jgi:hypothetical protein
MSANDVQIGGAHYRSEEGEQHWDRMYRLYGRGYFVGCSTKYIERYHLKNGKEDLEKAIHFLQKLIELEYPEAIRPVKCSLDSESFGDILKELDAMAIEVAGIPDHLKEFVPTERQKEVAAKFEDLRLKQQEAISPMLAKFMMDSGEPLPHGYVNQDK